jgi:transcription elongation factor Elf1
MSAETMSRKLLNQYRAAIRLLAEGRSGIALDITCPHCGFPEMSGTLNLEMTAPIGLRMCRKCGHAEVVL